MADRVSTPTFHGEPGKIPGLCAHVAVVEQRTRLDGRRTALLDSRLSCRAPLQGRDADLVFSYLCFERDNQLIQQLVPCISVFSFWIGTVLDGG